jgi:hypothetical protein
VLTTDERVVVVNLPLFLVLWLIDIQGRAQVAGFLSAGGKHFSPQAIQI